jgi:NTE family protein
VTNLNKGKWEIMQSGTIFDKVEASCAIPLIFKPVQIGNQLYADGGMLNNLPTEPLRIVCDKIIGVSVMPVSRRSKINGFIEMAERSIDIVVHDNTDNRLDDCDVKLEIQGIDMFGLFEFNHAKEIYQLGYDCAKGQMKRIKEVLEL